MKDIAEQPVTGHYPDPGTFRNILIIRLGALGDVIRTLPALRAIRHRLPRARICWLVEEGSRELLEGHPDLDQVILLPRQELSGDLKRPWRLPRALGRLTGIARKLRAEQFDAVFELHGLLKSGLLARASGAPVRFGFPPELCREGSHRFLTHPLPVPAELKNRVERLFKMLSAAGFQPQPGAGTGIFPREAHTAAVLEFLERDAPEAARDSRGLVVMSAGSSAQQSWKRWPGERFSAVARELSERLPAEVVLSWGPGERDMAQAVLEASGGSPHIHLAPRFKIMELAALLQKSRLFIGGDSGPMHLAAAMGTTVVGIFGPTDPELNRPLAPGGFTAVEPPGDFSRLSKQERRRSVRMEEVEMDQVLAAADDAFRRAWSSRTEVSADHRDEPPPVPVDQTLTRAAILTGPVEAQVITHLLEEDHIPHLVRRFREIAFDGIFEMQKGYAELLAPPEKKDQVCALLESVRSGEGLEDLTEGPDA